MHWFEFQTIIVFIQRCISFAGILIILFGVLIALGRYIYYLFTKQLDKPEKSINVIRLRLGRNLLLGLEFIVAADLIGTVTKPGYYDIGILGIIVIIRSILSFTLSYELMGLNKER